jgi:hypothetical protein
MVKHAVPHSTHTYLPCCCFYCCYVVIDLKAEGDYPNLNTVAYL